MRIYCLIIMTKISTGSTLPSIVRGRLSHYTMNFLLLTGLMVVFMLRLLLWPVRVLNKGLRLSGTWMFQRLD